MEGLRKLWDLGEAEVLDPQLLHYVEQGKRAFLEAIGQLNEQLKYTAANAPPSSHATLVKLRDDLFDRYQRAVTQVASKADFDEGGAAQADASDLDALTELVARTKKINSEAVKLVNRTRDLKQRWEQQATTLESTEDAIAQSSEAANGDVAALEQRLGRAVEAANGRDFQTAIDELSAAAGAAKQLSSTAAPTAQPPPVVNEKPFPLKGKLPQEPVVPDDPEALANWQNPLIDGDPRELFNPARMDDVVDMHFQGQATADDPRLNEAMNAVLRAGPKAGREELLKHFAAIGEIRGIYDPKKDNLTVIEGQVDRYLQLQSVAEQLGNEDEAWTTRRDEYLDEHGEFLGTRSNLRFGQVVGEATGLDPAYAALLSPTGGMVGPGMDVLAPTDADTPVIWHGIFHDAGGYLLNNQKTGPGYTYLEHVQPDSGTAGEHCFQGQVEGVSYWYDRQAKDRSVLEDILLEPEFLAADPEQRQTLYARLVKHPAEDAETLVENLTEDAVGEVRELTEEVRQFSQDSVNDLKDTTHAAGDAVQEQVEAANNSLDSMASKARELGVDDEMVDQAHETISGELQSVHQQIEIWEQQVAGKFDTAGQVIEEKLSQIEQWTEEAGAAIRDRTAEMSAEIQEAAKLKPVVQSEVVQEIARRGVNLAFGDTSGEVAALADLAGTELEKAKLEVEQFYQEAVKTIEQQGAEQLAAAKDDLVGKLTAACDLAVESARRVQVQIDQVERELSEAQQSILDSASGVTDSLADAVDSGTNTLANVMGSATDFAADRLDSLTNLLG